MVRKGPWSAAEVDEFLDRTQVPLRIACNAAMEYPLLASLWFLPADGALWCATPRSAQIAKRLERDAACAFEISLEAPPYRGVRGQGRARLHVDRGEAVLRSLLDRYVGGTRTEFARTLLAKAADEVAIEIVPRSLVSWDFTERMQNVA